MKIKSLLALFLLSFVAPQLASAQTGGQSASGTYQFSLDDGYTKYVEFDAQANGDGTASGRMLLSDEAPLYYTDLDGAGEPEGKYPGFYIKAEFDALVVNRNQAVMSGTVSDSSIRELVGQRVLLMVEDNGDKSGTPDELTWGVYKPQARGWIPSDAELKEDPGVGLRWHATDAERTDDAGIEMPKDESITAQTFPVSSYAFVTVRDGVGDIVVRS